MLLHIICMSMTLQKDSDGEPPKILNVLIH